MKIITHPIFSNVFYLSLRSPLIQSYSYPFLSAAIFFSCCQSAYYIVFFSLFLYRYLSSFFSFLFLWSVSFSFSLRMSSLFLFSHSLCSNSSRYFPSFNFCLLLLIRYLPEFFFFLLILRLFFAKGRAFLLFLLYSLNPYSPRHFPFRKDIFSFPPSWCSFISKLFSTHLFFFSSFPLIRRLPKCPFPVLFHLPS